MIQINNEHFVEWYLEKCESELLNSNLTYRYKMIYDEYVKLNLEEFCDRKDSDMQNCPYCLDCPYFSDEIIKEYTNAYLKNHLEILTDDLYDFAQITKESLREIF